MCGSIQNFIGTDGSLGASQSNANSFRNEEGIQGIFLRSHGVHSDAEQWGTLALSTTAAGHVTFRTEWAKLSWGNALLDFWDDFSNDGRLEERESIPVDSPTASLSVPITIPPNAIRSITFLLSWHFPNRLSWRAPDRNPQAWDMGAKDRSDPDLQLAGGCLVDQLFGQFLAHVCGLGYLASQTNIRKALESVLRYNRKSDFYGHFNHMRSYVLNDESALVMASYPRGNRPVRPFPYYNEVMAGFEYVAAIGLLYENEQEAGLRCIKAIRDRYDGRRRNPFNEAECGHHYARAMASWAAILAYLVFTIPR